MWTLLALIAVLLSTNIAQPPAGAFQFVQLAGDLSGDRATEQASAELRADFTVVAESGSRDGFGVAFIAETEKDKGSSEKAEEDSDEIRKLKMQIIELQNKGKLGFRRVVPCTSVEQYGVYSPLEPGNELTTLILYVEPSNWSTLATADRFIIDCSVDLMVYDPSGKLLGGKNNILNLNRVSRSPVLDLYFKVSMNLKKPLKREIVLKTVLRDKIKNQSVSATYKIGPEGGAKRMQDSI